MLLYTKKIHFIVPIKLKFDYFIIFILQLLLQKYGMQRDEFNNIYPHGTITVFVLFSDHLIHVILKLKIVI